MSAESHRHALPYWRGHKSPQPCGRSSEVSPPDGRATNRIVKDFACLQAASGGANRQGAPV